MKGLSGFLVAADNSCWGTGKIHASFLSFFFVVVPLISELAVEILEKGEVRFWLQAEKLSGNAKANFVFNDKEIFNGEVRLFTAYVCLHFHEYQWGLVSLSSAFFQLVFYSDVFSWEIACLMESMIRKILSIVLSSRWILLDAFYKGMVYNAFLPLLWIPRFISCGLQGVTAIVQTPPTSFICSPRTPLFSPLFVVWRNLLHHRRIPKWLFPAAELVITEDRTWHDFVATLVSDRRQRWSILDTTL